MESPNYSLIVATTIDGKIAAQTDQPSNWTSDEDKIFLRKMLDETEVIIVGRTTYEVSIGPLSQRNCLVFTRSTKQPQKIRENLVRFNPEEEGIDGYVRSQSYESVAVLGGMQTYSYFLERELVTDLYLTIEPIVFGSGISIFETSSPAHKQFELVLLRKLNTKGSILLHYRPVRPLGSID